MGSNEKIRFLSYNELFNALDRVLHLHEIDSLDSYLIHFNSIVKSLENYLGIPEVYLFRISEKSLRIYGPEDKKPGTRNNDHLKIIKKVPILLRLLGNTEDPQLQKVADLPLKYEKEKGVLEQHRIRSFIIWKTEKLDVEFGVFILPGDHFKWNKEKIGEIKVLVGFAFLIQGVINIHIKYIKSKEKFRLFADRSFDVEKWIRPDGSYEYISPSTERVSGYTQKDFFDSPELFNKIVHPDDLEKWLEQLNRISNHDIEIDVDLRIQRKDKEIIWVHIHGQRLYDYDGQFAGYRYSCKDVTQRVKSENDLKVALKKLEDMNANLMSENVMLRKTDEIFMIPGFISENAQMLKIIENVKKVANTNTPVLIIGETGTGKELLARALHEYSKRKGKSLVTVNCAAIPSALLESELFGREKGAYTGAMSRQAGLFQMANNSSIFLDEIGELPIQVQSKLLRVLQFGEYSMLGSPKTHKVDARIIAATNKNLEKASEEGLFRSDLFYRLNVFPIHVPPLRERRNDIPLLVWEFIRELNIKLGKRISHVSASDLDKMINYHWPGNLRELRNVIEYSMILSNTRSLQLEMHQSERKRDTTGQTLDEVEHDHILYVLEQCGWKIRGLNGAARILGLNESTLRFRMKKLNIQKPVY